MASVMAWEQMSDRPNARVTTFAAARCGLCFGSIQRRRGGSSRRGIRAVPSFQVRRQVCRAAEVLDSGTALFANCVCLIKLTFSLEKPEIWPHV